MAQCFKSKEGTSFANDIKKSLELEPKWDVVFTRVGEMLGEEITKMAITRDFLRLDPSELKNEENKKLFKADGMLKNNTKKAKQLFKDYQEILKEEGLEEYDDLRTLHFLYGVMRRRGQSMQSFQTSEKEMYYSADFDLEKSSGGNVVPITEVEYHQKYIEELEKRDKKNEEE